MFATPAWGAIVRGRPARSRRAICAEAGLRRADAQFDRNYARLLERLDLQQRRRLIETQRRWLKQREACADQEAVACVADAIRKREKEIAQAFSDGYDFGSVRLCCTGQTLRLGSKTLGVVAPTDGSDVVPLRLLYENRTVLEIFGWLEIDGRGGGSAEAVVVSTHGYGTAGCSDQYLISVRANQASRVEPLVVDGDPCWRIFAVQRNAPASCRKDECAGPPLRVRVRLSPSRGRFSPRTPSGLRLLTSAHFGRPAASVCDRDISTIDNRCIQVQFYWSCRTWAGQHGEYT
jgi:hypothetical protein